jgi:hypothetical protein
LIGNVDQEWEGTITSQDAEKWGLTLPEAVPNLFLSRHTVHYFLLPLVKARTRMRPDMEEMESDGPFFLYVQKNVPRNDTRPHQFFASLLWALNEYSAEPTFLAYKLLMEGQINEHSVQDNFSMCEDLIQIFKARDDEQNDTISKQNLYHVLSDLLPPKSKDMLRDLQTYLPSGAPDVLVNYNWLLRDDLYVPSPLIYGLRLQHLQQVVDVTKNLSDVINSAAKDGKIMYKDVNEATKNNPFFFSIDVLRGFGLSQSQIKLESEVTVDEFMSRVKQQIIFPAVLPDEFATE